MTPNLPTVPAVPPGVAEGPVPSADVPPVGPLVPPSPPTGGAPPPGVLLPPAIGPGPMEIPLPVAPVERAPSVSLPQATDPTPPRAEPAPSDLDRLQGVWVLSQLDGKPATGDSDTLEILKDRVLASDGTHGRIRVDEARARGRLTLTLGKQPTDEVTGIYKLEGDRLTISASTKSPKLIPTGFDPDPDAGVQVSVYERPKPPPAPAAAPRDATRADPGPKPPARDLQKEIDLLREQLKRLEREVKDRKD